MKKFHYERAQLMIKDKHPYVMLITVISTFKIINFFYLLIPIQIKKYIFIMYSMSLIEKP